MEVLLLQTLSLFKHLSLNCENQKLLLQVWASGVQQVNSVRNPPAGRGRAGDSSGMVPPPPLSPPGCSGVRVGGGGTGFTGLHLSRSLRCSAARARMRVWLWRGTDGRAQTRNDMELTEPVLEQETGKPARSRRLLHG